MSITNNSGTIYYDKLLSNYAVDYMDQKDKFINSRIFPNVIVDKQSDKYAIFGAEGLFDIPNDLRAKGTPSEEVETLTMSDNSYFCNYRALKDKIYMEDIQNASPIMDEKKRKLYRVMNQLLTAKEYRASVLAFTAGNYDATSKATIAAADQWSLNDYANNDPQKIIRDYAYTICQRTGLTYEDLTLVLNDQSLNGLRRSPFVQAYMASTATKNIDAKVLAGYFGIKEVLIGSSGYNTAKEGQTVSMTGMWGKNALLCYINPAQSKEDSSFGKTFLWNGLNNSATENRGIVGSRTWKNDDTRTIYVEAELNYDQKIVFQSAAYLLSDIIA